jgi:hypothetical protein
VLQLLDEAFEAYLRDVVPLQTRDVDVVFNAPDRDWAATISRPTINLYLWDVRPNDRERELGLVEVRDGNGRPHLRGPLPRVDCRYLVTAWTTDVRDEHSLLGRVLMAVLNNPVLAAHYLPPPLNETVPLPRLDLRSDAESKSSELWNALGGQLKPGLDVVLTTTVDAAQLTEVGPPVDTVVLRQRSRDGAGGYESVVARGDPPSTPPDDSAP